MIEDYQILIACYEAIRLVHPPDVRLDQMPHILNIQTFRLRNPPYLQNRKSSKITYDWAQSKAWYTASGKAQLDRRLPGRVDIPTTNP